MTKNYLYVLLLPHMDEEYNLSYKIKFGFSEDFDNRLKSGYEAYYGKGGVKVLHVYEGNFSKNDETKIKQHLKEYCLYGAEWFKCCQEVLGFFNTYDTSEKLRSRIDQLPKSSKNGRGYYEVNYLFVECILENYYKDITNLTEIQSKRVFIYNKLRNFGPTDQIKFIKENYNISEEILLKYVKDNSLDLSKVSNKVKRSVEQFNELSNSVEKLRYLVKLSKKNISKKDMIDFLGIIPPKFRDYYVEMGPDRIRANSFQESKLKEEWNKQKRGEAGISDELANVIFGYFKPGYRYSKSRIKETLKEMYQKYGYQKTAKASDLQEYFWTKDVKFLEDGKWVNGFEIQGKR